MHLLDGIGLEFIMKLGSSALKYLKTEPSADEEDLLLINAVLFLRRNK